MSKLVIATLSISAVLLSGCASPLNSQRSMVKKTADAEIVLIEDRTIRVEPKKNKGVTTSDAALTGIAANNIGNGPVQGATLLLGLLTGPDKGYNMNQTFYVAKDIKTGEIYNLFNHSFHETMRFKNTTPVVGDVVRIHFASNGGTYAYNLTKNPELDEITK